MVSNFCPSARFDTAPGLTRVGAAQDMIAAGIELPAILQAGRWKSPAMVNRYGERLLARKSRAAVDDARIIWAVLLSGEVYHTAH